MSAPAGIAARFARKEYGGEFTHRESTVAVGIAVVPAVPYNPNRVALLVTNVGTTNITLKRDPDVVSGAGILLLGNGSTFSSTARDDGNGVAFNFYAISDLAGGSLFVEETVESPTQNKEGG